MNSDSFHNTFLQLLTRCIDGVESVPILHRNEKLKEASHLLKFGADLLLARMKIFEAASNVPKRTIESDSSIVSVEVASDRYMLLANAMSSPKTLNPTLSKDPLQRLPTEIFSMILRHYMQSSDLYSCALVSREWFDVSNPFLWMNPDPRDQTAFEVLLRGMALGHMARSSPERILKVLDDEAFFSLSRSPYSDYLKLRRNLKSPSSEASDKLNMRKHRWHYQHPPPGSYVRSIQFRYWFRLPSPFSEMLLIYTPNLKVLPRIGFFSFTPNQIFFNSLLKLCPDLISATMDCLSPVYISGIVESLSKLKLKDLRIVNLDNTVLGAKFASCCKSFVHLEKLAVSFSQNFTDKTLKDILSVTHNLQDIAIDFATQLTYTAFVDLWDCPSSRLSKIAIEHCPMIPLENTSALTGSHSMNLGMAADRDLLYTEVTSNISKSRESLKELRLVKTCLQPSTLSRIPSLAPNLTRLLLSDRYIVDDVVAAFARNCPFITVCSLAGCTSITDHALFEISNTWASASGRLTKLCLDQTKLITSDGLKVLLSSQTFTKRLESLSLFECEGLSNEGVIAITSSVTERFMHLNIGCIPSVSNEVLETFINTHGHHLKVLAIDGFANQSDGTIIKAIAQFCRNLVKLDLGRCEAADRKALENMLGCLTGLKKLHADGIDVHNIEEELYDVTTGSDRNCKMHSVGRITFMEFPPL